MKILDLEKAKQEILAGRASRITSESKPRGYTFRRAIHVPGGEDLTNTYTEFSDDPRAEHATIAKERGTDESLGDWLDRMTATFPAEVAVD